MYVKICSNIVVRNVFRQVHSLIKHHQRNESRLISQESYLEYELSVPKIINTIPQDIVPKEITDSVKKISDFSIKRNEKIMPSSLTIHAFEKLSTAKNITPMNQIRTLAWSADMVHTYFLILSDVEDNGTRSKGKTCWQIYDASLIRSFVYEVLKTSFIQRPCYLDCIHLFDKAFLNTSIGYHLDNISTQNKDYSNINKEQLNYIIDYKTFHIFNFPILLGMKMCNISDQFCHRQVESICRDLGRLYQIQRDYLNVYALESDQPGLPTHSTDIQLGRFSWLFVTALQRCNKAQRTVLTACYGSTEPSHVERVKLLYDQLQLPKIYNEKSEKLINDIVNKTNRLNSSVSPQLFLDVLNVITDKDC